MASAMSCPKCQSEHVQKISIIIEQGTIESEGKASTSGIAMGSDGSFASGVSKTTIKTSSQSLLAKQLETEIGKYQKKVGGSPIVGVYALLLFIGIPLIIYFGFKVSSFFDAAWTGWVAGIVLFLGACGLIQHLEDIGKFAPDKETKEWWDRLDRWGQNGCYCHSCGNKFIPGSDEPHFTTLNIESL